MIIAIDPGVNCGVAIIRNGIIVRSGEYPIWDVFETLTVQCEDIEMVLLEDARKNFRTDVDLKTSIARAQGAGWVKTLCGQFERFLKGREIKYKLIKPNKIYLKKSVEFVKLQTGVDTKKGEGNRRDALMILHYYK